MSFRSRVYKTTKLGNGERMVTSISTSNWFIMQTLKKICKFTVYIMFFWIIIPIKIFKKR